MPSIEPGLRVGETVLIVGVGGVGSIAVQLAKAAGARVLAVELSEAKREWARQLGADEIARVLRTGPFSS